MKKSLALILAAVATAATATGLLLYYYYQYYHVSIMPKIISITHEWGFVNETVTEVRTFVVIENPAPASATLKELHYKIYLNDIEMAEGHNVAPVVIPARGTAEIELSTLIDNTKIPVWWVSHVQNGEKTWARVEGEATVEVLGQELKIPVSVPSHSFETNFDEEADVDEPKDIVLVDLRPLLYVYVTVESVDTSWGSVTEDWTELVHVAQVYNPNEFDIPVTKLEYNITANGVRLAHGEQPLQGVLLGAKKTSKVTFYTYIDNHKLDDWWVTHLKNDEETHVVVQVWAVFEFVTPIGTFTVKELVYQKDDITIKTDILGSMTYP